MKIVCTRKRELSEKDPLIVMVNPPEDYPGSKIVIEFPLGTEIDLKKLVKERAIKYTAEELGHVILGDKRYKGLFKIVGAGATTTETETEATPTPTKKGKIKYSNKAIDTDSVNAG